MTGRRPTVPEIVRGLVMASPPVRIAREIRNDYDEMVVVLAIGDLISNFGFALVFPFLSLYLTSVRGATVFQAGLLLGMFGLCRVVSNALGGWLSDRAGRRRVMIVSISATAFLLAALGQARDIESTTVVLLLLGLFDPAFGPAARAVVADVVDSPRRPRAYALLAVAQNVGWIAGPAAGAGLAAFGYPLLFTLAAIAVGTYAVIVIRFLRETRPTQSPPAEVRRTSAYRLAVPSAHGIPGDRAAIAPAGVRAPRLAFIAFLAVIFFVHIAEAQWFTTLPVYGSQVFGVTTQEWGLLFALNGLLIVALQLRVSRLMEGRSKLKIVAFGTVSLGAAFAATATIPGAWLAVPILMVTMTLVTVGEMIFEPLLPSIATDLSSSGLRGRYIGAIAAAVAAGEVVGPPLGGAILDHAPGPLLWLLAALVCACGASAIWFLAGRIGHYRDPSARPAETPEAFL